nr:CMP-sialic acid transporter 1-like isoform X2 [Quercus suber]
MADIASSIEFSSLERDPEVTTSKDDYRLEECPFVPYSFNHIPDPQQCSVCYPSICGCIHISNHGKSQDCHNWNIVQWMAIVLLAVGTTMSQVKGCGEASCDSLFSAPIQGYMFGILSACLSAFAGIYTEFLMKKNDDTLYWQNVQLYTFGAIFNMARLLLDDFRNEFEKGPWWQRLFNGYSFTTWLVVLNLGSTGLLVSWLMKYADNIVKVYSTSMAMPLTTVLSLFLFDFRPTLQLFLGIVVCMMSLHMYFAPPSMLIDLPKMLNEDSESLLEVYVDRRTDSSR